MILENQVIEIIKKEMPRINKHVKWDGMYDEMAKKIVTKLKQEIVNG